MARGNHYPKRVKVDAYNYASGVVDRPPHELTELSYIDRFGVMAVYGRQVLSYGEMQKMLAAENVIRAYRSRQSAPNRGKWAQENQDADGLLNDIEILIHENGTNSNTN